MVKVRKRGRPPRTDNPVAIRINLPGELRHWLLVQAGIEQRDQGDLVTDALRAYRKSTRHAARKIAEAMMEGDWGKGGKP